MSKFAVYFVRWLPAKTTGLGELVHAFSTESAVTLEMVRAENPALFVKLGFYSLLRAEDDYLEIGEPKA